MLQETFVCFIIMIVTNAIIIYKRHLNKDKLILQGGIIMRTRNIGASLGESRLMDTEELRAYTNLGRNNAMKLGEEIGAKVKIGKRVLWDRKKIDQYFNELTGAE